MILRRHIGDYNFFADTDTGITLRWGKTLKDNPSFAPVPELADISISNHCTKGCDFCYRNSCDNNSFITVEDYVQILKKLNHPSHGNVFQVALGGGEPLEHPRFYEILEVTRQYGIVPNFTTNGIYLNDNSMKRIKGLVGAVAVSVSNINELNRSKVELLVKNRIKTNIHFLLKADTVVQANAIVNGQYDELLKGINSVIFLTFKPCGRANENMCLKMDEDIAVFLNSVSQIKSRVSIGFDACLVPLILAKTNIQPDFIDTCEAGYFSVYIDERMNVKPCSFSGDKDIYNLKEFGFYEIWENKFSSFRERTKNKCRNNCEFKNECRGQCPYYPQITLCYS